MRANKNKINKTHLSNMTEEQRKIYDFIESNVSPSHRIEATLFMGHLSYIRDTCKKYYSNECVGCPFNKTHQQYGYCFLNEYPDVWQVEEMIKNIFSNLN